MLRSLLVTSLLSLACLSDAFRVRTQRKRKSTDTVRVGALGGHGPASWRGACKEASDTSLERAQCNLKVYVEAAKTAKSNGVDMLVLPEYGLINGGGFAEAAPAVGDQPCAGEDLAQVSQLSCIAQEHSVALASNIITSRSGNQFITSIVYDNNGTVVAVYDKNRLFPGEGDWATAGPFNPTVFELLGQKWGVCICYEAMDPFAGWAQFHSFRDQGAQHVVWNVGNTGFGGVFTGAARDVAAEIGVNVVGAMNKAMLWGNTTAMYSKDARELSRTTANLNTDSLDGYRASPFIHYATV